MPDQPISQLLQQSRDISLAGLFQHILSSRNADDYQHRAVSPSAQRITSHQR